MEPTTIESLVTPTLLVDVARMRANLDRLAKYTAGHGIALRPHIKTHKTPALALEQLQRGAAGLTVATTRESHVMADIAHDILMAYPPVGRARIDGLLALPESCRIAVGLDSMEALDALATAAHTAGRVIGVLVEMNVGMQRVGLNEPDRIVALARRAADLPGTEYRGVMFYPGHIRQHVDHQDAALRQLEVDLSQRLDSLREAGLEPGIVSGGSTPTAFASHRIAGITEIRPGTYIFNDRTTERIGACAITDCALTVLATVVSTAVPGQAVIDAGSKALGREPIRGAGDGGFGELLGRPEVTVSGMSEEHGILDLSGSDWKPAVGERVRVVPNHVCYVVNLHNRLHAVEHDSLVGSWAIAARGWSD